MVVIAAGKYRDWLTEDGLARIEQWAREGLTDEQIARKMGINPATLYKWQNSYGEISEALKKGKAPVDIQVENALLKRALGYDYEETTEERETLPTGKTDEYGQPIVIERVRTRRSVRHMPPDTTAQIYWLNNRRPDRWRAKPQPDASDTLGRLDSILEEMRRAAYTETG